MAKMNKNQRKNFLKKLVKDKPELASGKYLAINEEGQMLTIKNDVDKFKHEGKFDIYNVKTDLE